MTPETRSEAAWYAGVIYFSSWGSAAGLLLATGLFPRLAAEMRALAQVDASVAAVACIVLGHIVMALAPNPDRQG